MEDVALISVVVPSRDRPVRLRWLLNALEDQDAGFPFEVIVAHNSAGPETAALKLPARTLLDAVETAALLRGSLRYRTLLL